MPNEPPPQLPGDQYDLLEQVGEGAVADVWKAIDRQSGQHVAIKLMRRNAVELEAIQRLAQEFAILSELDHWPIWESPRQATTKHRRTSARFTWA